MDEHELTVLVTKIDERSKSNSHRLDDAERKLEENTDLLIAVQAIASREERLEGDVKEIKTDVKSLKELPAKRWESVVEKIVLVIVGAVIAAVLGRIGL